MSTAIEVSHLAYTYPGVDDTPGVAVFEDLNLQIEEGTFTAVLGSNGCGKSTLAKHFNTILLPSGGTVSVFGMDMLWITIAKNCILKLNFISICSINIINSGWH